MACENELARETRRADNLEDRLRMEQLAHRTWKFVVTPGILLIGALGTLVWSKRVGCSCDKQN